MKIKKIIIDAINDEMLKGLLKFSILDCHKVVVEINKNITIEDINNKILELNKIRYDLIELLFNDDLWKDIDNKKVIPNKYINNWIKVEFDEENDLTTTINQEKLDKVINFLISIEPYYNFEEFKSNIEDAIIWFIEDNFDGWYAFERAFERGYNERLNHNWEIEFIYK